MYPGYTVCQLLALKPTVTQPKGKPNEEEEEVSPNEANMMVLHRVEGNLEKEPTQVSLPHIAVSTTAKNQSSKVINFWISIDAGLTQIEVTWGCPIERILPVGSIEHSSS